jgi:hypothetical protein
MKIPSKMLAIAGFFAIVSTAAVYVVFNFII